MDAQCGFRRIQQALGFLLNPVGQRGPAIANTGFNTTRNIASDSRPALVLNRTLDIGPRCRGGGLDRTPRRRNTAFYGVISCGSGRLDIRPGSRERRFDIRPSGRCAGFDTGPRRR